jgi:hypothetical protein
MLFNMCVNDCQVPRYLEDTLGQRNNIWGIEVVENSSADNYVESSIFFL